MSKCQVIPLSGKVRAKHAEGKVTSFSAMLADGIADLLPEQRHARIYAFHRPESNSAHDMSDTIKTDAMVQHGSPRPEV